MAKYGPGSVAFVLVDGNNLVTRLSTVEESTEDLTTNQTPLGATFEEHAPLGVAKGTFSVEGWYDDASGLTDDVLAGNGETSRVVLMAFEGDTIGQMVRGMAGAYGAKYSRIAETADVHKIRGEFSVSGAVEEAALLHTLAAAETANGDTESSSVDNKAIPRVTIPITSNSSANPTVVTTTVAHGLTSGQVVWIAGVSGSDADINGAQTATVVSTTTFTVPVNTTTSGGTGGTVVYSSTVSGGAGYLNAGTVTRGGATNLAVTIRDSPDDSSYANLLSFATLTAAGAERVEVSGTVDRYLATSWVWTGGASSSTASFAVAFHRTIA